MNDEGDSIGEIRDFVVSTGERGTRAVIDVDEDVNGVAETRLIALPLDELRIELSAEEAFAIPQQARVRIDLHGAPLESFPAYVFAEHEAI